MTARVIPPEEVGCDISIADSETPYEYIKTITVVARNMNWEQARRTLADEVWLLEVKGWEKYGEEEKNWNLLTQSMSKLKDMGEPKFPGLIDYFERAPECDEGEYEENEN